MERIIFEVIPPPVSWSLERIQEWAVRATDILRKNKISFLNLPEVVSETRGERVVPYVEKMDNLLFSDIVKGYFDDVKPIINKICVRIKRTEFHKWIDSAFKKGIRHIIIVGGESSTLKYPGYSVVSASEYVKKRYFDVNIGAITILTRKGEVEKIVAKMKSGVDFFISQIVFETANIKQVLINLRRLTVEAGIPMPKMFISLTPASKIKDIEFMRWLGVEFPSSVLSYLTEYESKVEMRSFEILDRTVDEVINFMVKEKIKLGFNIEHVMYNNLELSEQLIEMIKERFVF
jgi:5,10-methylenetetrahydrofolate reductase